MLFLIYINDIAENIKSNIKLFADDTSLYVTVDEDAVNAANQLNDDLNQISTWAETWLVKFNANKSKALIVTFKRNLANLELPLSFNTTTLETVVKHKHLGVELSTNLCLIRLPDVYALQQLLSFMERPHHDNQRKCW